MSKIFDGLQLFDEHEFIPYKNHYKIEGIDNTPSFYFVTVEDEWHDVNCNVIISSSENGDVTLSVYLFIEVCCEGCERVSYFKTYGKNGSLDFTTAKLISKEFEHMQKAVYDLLYYVSLDGIGLLVDRFKSIMDDSGMVKRCYKRY